MTDTPFRYRGWHTRYVDIATRADEFLGIGLDYAVHPSTGVGCFIVRFAARGIVGASPSNYKHLSFRQETEYLALPSNTKFSGLRLNKIAVPVFDPAVKPFELAAFMDKFNVWYKLAEWVAAQVTAEGFTLNVDLPKELRGLVFPAPVTPEDSVKLVLEFPDLNAPEEKASALKLVKKPKPEPEDDDDDNGDDDEDDEAEEWLN